MNLSGKKVFIVLLGSELGGAERQALLLARYLKEEHHAEVRILGLSAERPGRVAQLCEDYGLSWKAVPFCWPDRNLGRLKQLAIFASHLRKQKPDILIPYTWLPNIVCSLVWKFTAATLCVWNQRDEGMGLEVGAWHQAAVRLVSCFVSNSQGGKSFLVRTYGIPENEVEVIRNGVVLDKPLVDRNGWRNKLGINETCFVACMVANLHNNKDHATLLEAWRVVIDRLPANEEPPVLLVAGRYHGTEEKLMALTSELGLNNYVHFLGKVDDVPGLLASADLCVHSSKSEGVPNSILEAMAAGLPVIGTDIPGIREALGGDKNDYLVSTGDHGALAELILKMKTNPEIRSKQGKSNREQVVIRFNPVENCEKMYHILTQRWNRD